MPFGGVVINEDGSLAWGNQNEVDSHNDNIKPPNVAKISPTGSLELKFDSKRVIEEPTLAELEALFNERKLRH